MSHQNLYNFYKTNFSLAQFHHYSFADIEGMIPFERDVYVALLLQHLEEEKQKAEARKHR